MPFGLKNAGATYQRLVNKMFEKMIGHTMEVYVDDMLVKSLYISDHLNDLNKMFAVLREYKMMLNPRKCTFGVGSGKFLGYMVSQRGIEANPDKIKAIIDLEPPNSVKKVQSLTGRLAALNRFVSRSTDKCKPFFEIIKKSKNFEWTEQAQIAFESLKQHLSSILILQKPTQGEDLYLYLAVSEYAISSVLIRLDGSIQHPVYYTSQALHDAELRYPPMEKLAYSLITAARKLRPYFLEHKIIVLTNYPLKQVLHRPDTSGRMIKWAIELSQFDIIYEPRTAIKGQALADFVAEFTPSIRLEVMEDQEWKLFVDGSSTAGRAGGRIVIIDLNEKCYRFRPHDLIPATNNEAEYEALLAGLDMAASMGLKQLLVHSDSQLVVHQINGEYEAKEQKIAQYLDLVKKRLSHFKTKVLHVPRAENMQADALARLGSSPGTDAITDVTVTQLSAPSLGAKKIYTTETTEQTWMTPIVQYLEKGVQPENKAEARTLRTQAARFTLVDGILYKRGYSVPLLRCLSEIDADYALREVHEGICGNHAGGQTLAYKLIRQGYCWPSLRKDATDLVKRCERCQRFAPQVRYHPEQLTSVFSPWPFAKWGMDLIGPLPTGKGGVKYAIVAVDYFTKWAEAEPLAKIDEEKIVSFVWKSIIWRFGIPHSIVTDNGKQFDNRRFRNFCEGFRIKNYFSTPYHPQSNGQVEAVNKILKYTLKARLEESKGNWPEELPGVLWSYRTTHRAATGETPFSLAYGAEAVIPVEIGAPTFRIANFEENCNEAALRAELDLLEEKRCSAEMKNAVYKQRSERYYNSKVKERRFQVGDLVLKKITGVQPSPLKPTWEGPFWVTTSYRGAYQLEYLSGEKFMHPWNVAYLKRYYQ
ncbi:hypothetical protein DH2020_048159 [Rehmannia glutinosa]|uniref:Uncharacterized protein n=1 Tax=Rehmannia glutinosa TaxID=99300 RepID=A0ABR0U7H3_REHGL